MKQIYIFVAIFLCCNVTIYAQGHANHLSARGIDPNTGVKVKSLKSSSDDLLIPAEEFRFNELFSNHSFAAFDVFDNYFYGNNDNTIYRYNLKGELIETYETPEDYDEMIWASFLNVSPDGTDLWAGYTNMGNDDDRIYSINIESGEWQLIDNIPGNFDLEFRNGEALISGLNSPDWNNPNSIFLLDKSDNKNHQKIIEIGGNSAGLAVDAAGNIYYGTYFLQKENAVYKWANEDVQNAIDNDKILTIDDGVKISDLPTGHQVYDCEVDADGNLLFNVNSFSSASFLVKWDGTKGDGLNYEVLAESPVETDWITMIKTMGSINCHKNGNAIFTSIYGKPIAQLTKKSNFISEVLEFVPAPGQFINKSPWGTPESKESLIGGVQGSMSLGAFGGYVVFKFEEPVKNHPDNPYGIDFTIFGNPLDTWSEPGSVWVMKDGNKNGIPDGTWYELAGSDYWFSSTIQEYEVTYFNPKKTDAADVPWTDNQGNSGYVLKNDFHNQPYYPQNDVFSNIDNESYTLTGTLIEGALDMRNPTYIMSYAREFGYVDNNPRGTAPWTIPNNPYNNTNENAGGDGFDISWAVDSEGNYVELDEIDFIKVVGAMQGNAGWLGEVSTEITGAAVTKPNSDITGVLEMIVIKELPYTIEEPTLQLEAFAFKRGRVKKDWQINWSANIADAYVDENNVLHLPEYSGELELTASLDKNPDITAIVSTDVDVTISSNKPKIESNFTIYPNPVTDKFRIEGVKNANIKVINTIGSKLIDIVNYNSSQAIGISNLPRGIYLVVIETDSYRKTLKLIKQ
ncbi:T9SS type A sorting domain-containing protein [Marinilabiliaceae bacterium ANBcel2]|nr:T9SS type A sorting domain-containing protein [Marinilabiliaceae bacterium ANBcel2]